MTIIDGITWQEVDVEKEYWEDRYATVALQIDYLEQSALEHLNAAYMHYESNLNTDLGAYSGYENGYVPQSSDWGQPGSYNDVGGYDYDGNYHSIGNLVL